MGEAGIIAVHSKDVYLPQEWVAALFIVLSSVLALLFSAVNWLIVSRVKLGGDASADQGKDASLVDGDTLAPSYVNAKVKEITDLISEGANAFLMAEYKICAIFIVLFGLFLFGLLAYGTGWAEGAFSAVAFLLGSTTSIVCGYLGMKIAVYANGRTAVQAQKGVGPAFVTAFTSGAVMGFSLVGLGLLILFIGITLFRIYFLHGGNNFSNNEKLYEAIASYGLGGSSIALFGRVGGGIYTKAADVGADLVGKVEAGIPEDDPRNPAVIADNVGDNVGDIAGMGADLFGSFAESTCAALVISSTKSGFSTIYSAQLFPLLITAAGIIVCFLTSFVATHIWVVKSIEGIEASLKRQLLISTVLMTPTIYAICVLFLPQGEFVMLPYEHVTHWKIFICVASGLWSGLIIGLITEYYTSHSYGPVREVANSCETGAATNIIYGLALGYMSVVIPVLCLAISIYLGYALAHMYGIAMAALGMLSTLSIGLTIDAYGPISDNAGGIAEMAGLGEEVRKRTDALDAAGNTTAAIGKGFAIGSAALVSLALFGAFLTRAGNTDVNIMKPKVFAGLLVGAMLPYGFSAMTMKSVGKAALAMVVEVRNQFATIPGIMEGTGKPDYRRCVAISTTASLREMIPPGLLVMGSPFVVGLLFGIEALAGVLSGGLVSGVQMAISSSNTGGAWDNAKKYVEQGHHGGKGSEPHKAAVIGDTVGDPLKDTSGPALNILMKLMAILSLVLAPFFVKVNKGNGALSLPSDFD